MTEPLQLALDDEEAGGTTHWYKYLSVSFPLPAAGDWVWGPEGCDEEGEPVGDRYTRYEVVRLSWNFVSPGSINARDGNWTPLVRVHVRRAETPIYSELERHARGVLDLVEARFDGNVCLCCMPDAEGQHHPECPILGLREQLPEEAADS